MNMKSTQQAFLWALLLAGLSWASVHIGIAIGVRFFPPDLGYPLPGGVMDNLFRFDSVYYRSIAESGYAYNGDPGSSPNLAFAPLFPVLVRMVCLLPGVDVIDAGFALNKVLLLGAFTVFYLVLKEWVSQTRALFILFAMGTSAGSYAFHAFYSESTMLFLTGLALLAYQRRQFGGVGLAAAALGASRLAAFPMALAFSALLVWEARKAEDSERLKLCMYALLSLLGTATYLGYIGVAFGNPFSLLDQIQKTSWGLFHQQVDWPSLLSGGYLISYWKLAINKGVHSFDDIQTMNLVWMSLGLLSAVYLLAVWRRHVLTYVLVPYLLFVYYADASSEFLISTHRFFSASPSIFLMLSAIPAWLAQRTYWLAASLATAGLLVINLCYGWLHTGRFNQGVWFWF